MIKVAVADDPSVSKGSELVDPEPAIKAKTERVLPKPMSFAKMSALRDLDC
jgi:hypothetical protein